MKINVLNKNHILITVLSTILLFTIGYSLWEKKGTSLFQYSFNKEKQEQMLIETEKFEWLASAGASEMCPMEIVNGSFTSSDNSTEWIPNGEYLNTGWGNGNGVWSVGNDIRKLPKRMDLTWFSYTENKFFSGSFELPQQKLYSLFKKDYGKNIHPDGSEFDLKFSELTIGLAPKGMITVWVSGFAQIEIGTYQAHEINIEWKDFYRGEAKREIVLNSYQKDMLSFVQEEIIQNKINNTYWKKLLEKYNYSIKFNKEDEYKLYDYEIWFINHETINKSIYNLNYFTKSEIEKAIPKNMVLYLEDNFGRQIEVRINIFVPTEKKPRENLSSLEERNNNENLIKIFKSYFDKNKNVELYIKFNKEIVKSNINKPVYSGKVYLKSPTSEIEIPNSKVEVYNVE